MGLAGPKGSNRIFLKRAVRLRGFSYKIAVVDDRRVDISMEVIQGFVGELDIRLASFSYSFGQENTIAAEAPKARAQVWTSLQEERDVPLQPQLLPLTDGGYLQEAFWGAA